MEETTRVDKSKFYKAIKELMSYESELTAREIGVKIRSRYHLGDGTRQAVQPRITELVRMGFLYPVGKKIDKVTKKRVTIYSSQPLRKEGLYEAV